MAEKTTGGLAKRKSKEKEGGEKMITYQIGEMFIMSGKKYICRQCPEDVYGCLMCDLNNKDCSEINCTNLGDNEDVNVYFKEVIQNYHPQKVD